jgi:hypothetical protein
MPKGKRRGPAIFTYFKTWVERARADAVLYLAYQCLQDIDSLSNMKLHFGNKHPKDVRFMLIFSSPLAIEADRLCLPSKSA